MLEHLEQVLLAERPDWVLIYGDCDTTLAAGLAARKIHIPVAHVEAGLRSYDKSIAEEVNRVVADYVSILNFCPSVTCVQNLAAEGMSASIRYTGDIMYDILLRMRGQSDIIKRLGLVRKQSYLATVHRAETTDYPDRLRSVFEALHEISVCRWPVILPMHPRTRLALQRAGPEVSGLLENIRVIDPVTYTEILDLQEASRMVITDSGGLQKEAYWLGVPCVTMTDTNEWIELTRLGVNTVVGTDRVKILEAVEGFEGCGLDRPMNVPKDVYGRGQSADEVVRILVNERLA